MTKYYAAALTLLFITPAAFANDGTGVSAAIDACCAALDECCDQALNCCDD